MLMTDLDKKQFYDNATKKILNQLNGMNLPADKYKEAVKWTKIFRAVFEFDEFKQEVFIEKDNPYWDFGYDSAGFCRMASITFSILMDFREWQLMAIDKDQWGGKMGHHYLKHLPSGKYFDLTYDQFAVEGFEVPYNLGKPATFGLSSKDETMRFSKALGIDLQKVLKEYSKRGK